MGELLSSTLTNLCIVLYCPRITILYLYKSIKMKNEAKQLEI